MMVKYDVTLKKKINELKIQISEHQNLEGMLRSKLNETTQTITVLRGKLIAYAEMLKEITGEEVDQEVKIPVKKIEKGKLEKKKSTKKTKKNK